MLFSTAENTDKNLSYNCRYKILSMQNIKISIKIHLHNITGKYSLKNMVNYNFLRKKYVNNRIKTFVKSTNIDQVLFFILMYI